MCGRLRLHQLSAAGRADVNRASGGLLLANKLGHLLATSAYLKRPTSADYLMAMDKA